MSSRGGSSSSGGPPKPPEVGVPAKILRDLVEGQRIQVETTTGDRFEGKLVEAEENMNMAIEDVTVTFLSGKTQGMSHVYMKGTKVKLIVLPDRLVRDPMFQRVIEKANQPPSRGGGRGGRRGGGRGFGRGGGRGGGGRPFRPRRY